MHKLLARQLKRLGLSTEAPHTAEQWEHLLERVSCAYGDADNDRYTLERSINLSSAEMLSLNERLRAERDKLRAIFESAALGILSVDPNGRVLDANPAAQRMLGRRHDEIVKAPLSAFFAIEVPGASGAPTVDSAHSAEHRYDHPSGSPAWFNTTVTWVVDARGMIHLGTVVLEDITERKHLECSLRHAQKLEAVGRLAAGVAHEINTPIQFVNDNVHFLRGAFVDFAKLLDTVRQEAARGGEALSAKFAEAEAAADWEYLGTEVPKSIAQTIDGLQRVATIVHSMKSFAHSDRSEQAPTDLNAALESTLVVAGHELKGVAHTVKRLGELPLVMCHRGDLNQVFLNLIVNAAHAISDVVGHSGETGCITVRTWVDGDHVAIAIADTGGGIPSEVAAKMFDPFFTTKEVGRGTGQGLALARNIVVNNHKGTISYDTKIGGGTTFTIRLPIAGEHQAKEAA